MEIPDQKLFGKEKMGELLRLVLGNVSDFIIDLNLKIIDFPGHSFIDRGQHFEHHQSSQNPHGCL
jgi:hypothetical protein